MIRIRQLKINYLKENNLKEKIAKTLHVKLSDIKEVKVLKKSLDARKKDNIFYVYEVDVLVLNEKKVLKKCSSKDILLSLKEEYKFPSFGTKDLKARPIIVGSGPAGLFCAYLLAEHGYKPIILERGKKIEDRIIDVANFFESGILDIHSNVQFGEGGAGTFSDGKLNTMVKDKYFRGKKVFEIFIENGAPEDIIYLNKPHIGTDILQVVVKNMRNKIIAMGGEFRYLNCLTNIFIKDGRIFEIEVNHREKIACQNLILAIGHSARDTFKMLYDCGLTMVAKPFAIGVRIQHPQQMIQLNQYKTLDKKLPVADYKLTYTTKKNRGVYSFCMCPGGYVINASSEDGGVVVNGMSYHARNSKNANSALVVTVHPADFGSNPLDGIKFQKELERKAYIAGDGFIPVQLYGDFKKNKVSSSFLDVKPEILGKYSFADLNLILPSYVLESLKEAMVNFDNKIPGFARDDAILAGVESRTSSPVKICRDDNGEANILGVYPCGEGSGYAGGITTSAMDGIKVAELIAKKYKPYQK